MTKISKTKHITKKGVVKKNPVSKLPTKAQFKRYVDVQYEGRYNMFDPNARMLTGLDSKTYGDIMKHYGELARKYPEVINEVSEPKERKFYFAYKGDIVDYREASTLSEAKETFFEEFSQDVGAEKEDTYEDEEDTGNYEVWYEGTLVDTVKAEDEQDAIDQVTNESNWTVKFQDDGSRR